ncbi:uncharacterized protein MELLADRAFT_104041 [Melampsora larici-populina 98AG31]|uniref:Uncharacterized protein n=1 Tax=Melampsora larici-populina (strain 98AG31 / pathotype 3-4-7) TaxID=747676 RepID=F4RDD0_MELLP|nr:uncharacterized protein MELLADRAFT_104041 [Melampsora larici-populina 98AG31]EGG09380.1 hypothetical protein MELLADRAFT_104041 [Melampsora larici-populina 98AG31]
MHDVKLSGPSLPQNQRFSLAVFAMTPVCGAKFSFTNQLAQRYPMADSMSNHPYTDPCKPFHVFPFPSALLTIPKDIYASSEDPADPQIRCSACNSRTLADYRGHIKTAAHRAAVQRRIERDAADKVMLRSIQANHDDRMEDQDHDTPEQQYIDQEDPPAPDSPKHPLTPLSYLRDLHGTGISEGSSDSDHSDNILDFQLLRQALEAMNNLGDHPVEDHPVEDHPAEDADENPEEMALDDDILDVDPADLNGWYPFANKEVVSIWKPENVASSKSIPILAKFTKGRIVPFYGMREFITSERVFPCDIKVKGCGIPHQYAAQLSRW